MKPSTTTIYALTFATGAAGLVDQVVWQRYLGRLLGNDAIATATVLAVFLAGLSAGYGIWGRRTLRSPYLAGTYGVLECAIGLWAVAFPAIFRVVERVARGFAGESTGAKVLEGTALALLLVGPPAVCMGGTIPILTRLLSAEARVASRVHARVYACNTAGAVAGALAAGFLLVERFGLPGTLRLSALANLAAGAYFLRLRATAAPAGREEPLAALYPPALLCAVAWGSGFTFMTLETLWIRWTHLTLGASSVHFSLVVAALVLAIALGAATVARRRTRDARALAVNQLSVAAVLALAFPTLDLWPWAAHLLRSVVPSTDAGFYVFQALVFVALLAVLGVPGALMGATLPLVYDAAGKGLGETGWQAGRLLGWNAAGSLAGGLVGGYLLLSVLDLGQTYLVANVVALLSAALVALASPERRRLRVAALAPVAAVVAAVAVAFPYDPLRFAVGTFRLRGELDVQEAGPAAFYDAFYANRTILAYRDAPEGTFAVIGNLTPQQMLLRHFPRAASRVLSDDDAAAPAVRPRSIVVNGRSDSSTYYDRATLRLSAHLAPAFGVLPRNVFVVGLGTGVTAGELTLYPELERLRVAEISPTVGEFLSFFDDATRGLRADARYQPAFGDAFRLLWLERDPLDAIVSEPSNPWVDGVDQLFSREFYAIAAERLKEDGILVQWLQRYATTPEVYAIVLRTLRRQFPYVRAFRGAEYDDLLVASRRPLEDERLRGLDGRLAANERLRGSLADIEVTSAVDLLAREIALPDPGDGPVETLDRPRIHRLSARAFFRGDALEDDDASGL